MTETIICPPGYVLAGDLFGDWDEFGPAWRFLLYANLLALIPLGIAALLVWLPYQFYAALGAPLALLQSPDWPGWAYWVFGAVVIAASMLAHEGLHGVGLRLCGYRARFGFAGGYLYATAAPGQYLTRRAYLIMTLLPLTALTTTGIFALLALPAALGQIVLLALLLNAAASIGDLAVAGRTRRWPGEALFAAFGGIKVFLPEGCAGVQVNAHSLAGEAD
jgi:hypothetical protein